MFRLSFLRGACKISLDCCAFRFCWRTSDDPHSSMSNSVVLIFCIAGALVFMSVAQDIRGTPGVDYPNYHSIPETTFKCLEQKILPGFYADVEAKCQAFHLCFKDRQESFLCPIGTLFNQEKLVCDSWYNSNCSTAPSFYHVNSGPVMEKARKDIPMLLKLRNQSQSKLTAPTSTSNFLVNTPSLYETTNAEDLTPPDGTEATNVSEDLPEASGVGASNSEETLQNSETEVDEPEFPGGILSGLDDLQDVGIEVEGDFSDENEDLVEEIDTGLAYDPVTDGYYVNYDQYESEWQDPEPVSDEFRSFYDAESSDTGYNGVRGDSLTYEDYITGDVENKILTEPISESVELLDETIDAVGTKDFAKRQVYWSPPPKRVRKQPVYVLVDDEPEVKPSPGRRERSLIIEDESSTEATTTTDETESNVSTSGEVTSENSRETNETSDKPEDSQEVVKEPFPRPTRIPPHLLDLRTEVPMTTAEFEEAIFEELVRPKMTEEDWAKYPIISYGPDEEAPVDVMYRETEEELIKRLEEAGYDVVRKEEQEAQLKRLEAMGIHLFQDDDPSVYVDDSAGREDSSSLEDAIQEPGEEETEYDEVEVYDDTGSDSLYETEVPEDEIKAAETETFVVIPDDSESVEDVAIPSSVSDGEQYETESADSPNGYTDVEQMDAAPNVRYTHEYEKDYESRFELPDVYESYSKPAQRVPESLETWRKERQLHEPITPDLAGFPYEIKGIPYTEEGRVPFAIKEGFRSYSPEVTKTNWMYSDRQYGVNGQRGDYLYKQMRPSVPGYQQDQPMSYLAYDAESPYSYEDVYGNVYTGGNGGMYNYDATDYASGYYTNPENADWVQKQSNEDVELESGFGITDGPESNYEAADIVEESDELEEKVNSVPENQDQNDETYYVFDFDEQTDEDEPNLDLDGELNDLDRVTETSYSEADFESQETKENLSHAESVSGENASLDPSTRDEHRQSNIAETGSAFPSADSLLVSQGGKSKSSDSNVVNTTPTKLADAWSPTESNRIDEKPVTLSSALGRLAALKTVGSPQASNTGNMGFSGDSSYMSNAGFPESMGFGPYGFGANFGQQYGMVDSIQPSKGSDAFSHRTGESEQSQLSKLSAIQEKIRSMKHGKFGVFKKYMSSNKDNV